jgi:hypothetical protein
MAKEKLIGWMHSPATAALGTRSKVTVLRILWRAPAPTSIREIVRRSGQAYGSVDLAVTELLGIGILEEVPGHGRERRLRFHTGHRMAAGIAALLQAEADYFPALRIELRASTTRLQEQGLLSASIVGPSARREEEIGGTLDIVIIARDEKSAEVCGTQFGAIGKSVEARFGVRIHLIVYDRDTARGMWRTRTPAAARDVADSELLAGEPLASIFEA